MPKEWQFIVFEPFIRSYAHIEGIVFYHATESDGPSDCMWIIPGTANPEE